MSIRQNASNLRGLNSSVISTNYNGSVTPPTASIFAWYTAEAAYSQINGSGSLVTNSASLVSSLLDLSGNGRHLSGTGSQRPQFLPNEINGKPVLVSNGSSNYFTSSATLPTNFAVYMVMKQISWTSGDIILADIGVNVSITQGGTTPEIRIGSNGVASNTSASLNQYHLFQFNQNVAGTSYNKVGNVVGQGTSTISTRGSGFYLFGDTGNQANISLAELIIYSTTHSLSSGDGLEIQKYLNTKYGLRVFPGDINYNNNYQIDTSAELPLCPGVVFDGSDNSYVHSTYCPTNKNLYFSKYKGLSAGNECVVFSPTSQSIVTRISIGFSAQHISYDLAGDKVYIAASDAVSFYCINPRTNAIITDLGVYNAGEAAYCPSNGYLYVIKNTSPSTSTTVNVLNSVTNTFVSTINLPSSNSVFGIAYCPSNNSMYVSDLTSKVYTINCQSNTTGSLTIPSTAGYKFIYVPTIDRMLCGDLSHNIYTINPYTDEVKTIPMGVSLVPYSFCYNPKRDLIYIGGSQVYIVDPYTLNIIKTINTVTSDLTYCPVNGYVYACQTNGFTYLT